MCVTERRRCHPKSYQQHTVELCVRLFHFTFAVLIYDIWLLMDLVLAAYVTQKLRSICLYIYAKR